MKLIIQSLDGYLLYEFSFFSILFLLRLVLWTVTATHGFPDELVTSGVFLKMR